MKIYYKSRKSNLHIGLILTLLTEVYVIKETNIFAAFLVEQEHDAG